MAKTAYLFPGQGSQKVGMGKDLVERHPHLRALFERADEALGVPLTRLCFEGPDAELVQTQNTQPAIFLVSMAVLDVLRRAGAPAPQAAAGHSLGEYGALVCAGVLEMEDALRLVRRRGELMAAVNARTPGAMAAIIGPPPEAVGEICRRAAGEGLGVVEPANYNTPEQTVISGEERAVERAMALAKDAGAKVIRLQVGAPFHCSLMGALAEEFAAELERYDFREPRLPVVANVSGDYVRTADAVKDALRRQVAGAVRWTDSIRRLAADGFDTYVEVGPGRTLGGLVQKIQPGATAHATGDAKRLDAVLALSEGTA